MRDSTVSNLVEKLPNLAVFDIRSCSYTATRVTSPGRVPAPSDTKLELTGSAMLSDRAVEAIKTRFEWEPVARSEIPAVLLALLPEGDVLGSRGLNKTFAGNPTYAHGVILVLADDWHTIYFLVQDVDHPIECENSLPSERREYETHVRGDCRPLIVVYVERLDRDLQLMHGRFTLIEAVCSNGLIVSSSDSVFGGAPYSARHCAPETLTRLLDEACQLATDQADAGPTVYTGPNASTTGIKLACDQRVIELATWHELEEAQGFELSDDGHVLLESEVQGAAGAVTSSGFQKFRKTWNEIRQRITCLRGCDSPAVRLYSGDVDRLPKACEQMAFPD